MLRKLPVILIAIYVVLVVLSIIPYLSLAMTRYLAFLPLR